MELRNVPPKPEPPPLRYVQEGPHISKPVAVLLAISFVIIVAVFSAAF